jgi:hypothetical protein
MPEDVEEEETRESKKDVRREIYTIIAENPNIEREIAKRKPERCK